jgi:protein O-mannosyl-transferase
MKPPSNPPTRSTNRAGRQATAKSSQPTLPEGRGWLLAARENLWIYALLTAATLIVYSQVRHFEFLNHDDDTDVVKNYQVSRGITLEGIKWALVSGEECNWMPLTRISHMVDVELFGMRGGWHHVSNLLLHVVATLLLFAFLHGATGARWRSAFVAFLFALHPLHVESVAWVAERKDVLSAALWFLTLLAYVRYARHSAARPYLVTLFFFCLASMAKPMMVTLPFVLLLLDFWPLRRLAAPLAPTSGDEPIAKSPIPWNKAVYEKIPFFAVSVVASMVTYRAQQSGGCVKELGTYPIFLRMENAAISYLAYIGKMFRPANLAVFYPYPHSIPWWQACAAVALVIAISLLALRGLRKFPYIATGWFWYVGTLVPVIGLIQVGDQARADRYMYIPMTGLTIALAWGAAAVLKKWPRALASLAVTACVAAAAVTSVQAQYWKDSQALFQHALDVTDENYVAHNSLGTYLLSIGQVTQATSHLTAAVRINPGSFRAQTNLGLALMNTPGELPEATNHLQTAVRINPYFPEAQNNLGMALLDAPGRLPEAITHFQAALRLRPNYAEAHSNLASALLRIPGRRPEAISHYQAALRASPDSAEVHFNLGVVLSDMPETLPEAISHLEAAIRINPDADAHYALALALLKMPGRTYDAATHLQAALRLNPNFEQARQMLQQLQSAAKPGAAR